MAERKSVFVSMGRPFTAAQVEFRDGLLDIIRQNGLEPRVMNLTDYPTGNPLVGIAQVLRQCSGAVIVAFERTYFAEGIEKRNSEDQAPLVQARYTTPWSQIETAMAYALGQPILVMAEKALGKKGYWKKYDWYIERVEVSNAGLNKPHLRGRLAAWCRKIVEEQAPKKTKSPDHLLRGNLTISELLTTIRVSTLWRLALGAVSLFAAGATVGQLLKPVFGP